MASTLIKIVPSPPSPSSVMRIYKSKIKGKYHLSIVELQNEYPLCPLSIRMS